MKTLSQFHLHTIKDVREYILWLVRNGYAYHFDDGPDDIVWNRPVSPENQLHLNRLHDELWDVVDPWVLFENDRTLWAEYTGNPIEEVQ